jgi:hypothetical protein
VILVAMTPVVIGAALAVDLVVIGGQIGAALKCVQVRLYRCLSRRGQQTNLLLLSAFARMSPDNLGYALSSESGLTIGRMVQAHKKILSPCTGAMYGCRIVVDVRVFKESIHRLDRDGDLLVATVLLWVIGA